MFTGIVEETGKTAAFVRESENLHITVEASFAKELKQGQSIAHNGVCLTATGVEDDRYTVTAVKETLIRTNLKYLRKGDLINLERAMMVSGRFDGHFVQGHIDCTAVCSSKKDAAGSWLFSFKHDRATDHVMVEKGSVCVNGISLTVVSAKTGFFTVAVIPHTFEKTNFSCLKKGDVVNVEFDIIGKYIAKYFQH